MADTPDPYLTQILSSRRAALLVVDVDGGTAHEEPIAGPAHFAYVKIRNRPQATTGVVVKGRFSS